MDGRVCEHEKTPAAAKERGLPLAKAGCKYRDLRLLAFAGG